MVVMNLGLAFPALIRREAGQTVVRSAAGVSTTGDPDIYYVILDMYVRPDKLKSIFNSDNSDFVQYLEDRGFRVLKQSRSNYPATYFSLSSSLNFTYLDSLAKAQGPASVDAGPMIQMIGNNRVANFLRRRGYRVVTFESGYTGTTLPDADARYSPLWQLSEFQDLLLNTTMLAWLSQITERGIDDAMHARLIRYALKMLPVVRQAQRPSFVFAHIVCPHPPFVFDAQGACPRSGVHYYSGQVHTDSAGRRGSRGKGSLQAWFAAHYPEQVQYLDQLVEETVRRILADSLRPTIVILQGDHGPPFDPVHFTNLNAIRIPPSVVRHPDAPALYDTLTPVNSFRVLLSQVFDTSMALLPDRSYAVDARYPYDFHLVERPEEPVPKFKPRTGERHQ